MHTIRLFCAGKSCWTKPGRPYQPDGKGGLGPGILMATFPAAAQKPSEKNALSIREQLLRPQKRTNSISPSACQVLDDEARLVQNRFQRPVLKFLMERNLRKRYPLFEGPRDFQTAF